MGCGLTAAMSCAPLTQHFLFMQRGENGQLGNLERAAQTSPTPVFGGLAFSTIVAGHDHTCGIATDSKIYCWGTAPGNGIDGGTADPGGILGIAGSEAPVALSAG